jgi:hypothetical protein
MDELDLVLARPEGLDDAVDPIAGEAEDGVDAPLDQRLDKNVAAGPGHGRVLELVVMGKRGLKSVQSPRPAVASAR